MPGVGWIVNGPDRIKVGPEYPLSYAMFCQAGRFRAAAEMQGAFGPTVGGRILNFMEAVSRPSPSFPYLSA